MEDSVRRDVMAAAARYMFTRGSTVNLDKKKSDMKAITKSRRMRRG